MPLKFHNCHNLHFAPPVKDTLGLTTILTPINPPAYVSPTSTTSPESIIAIFLFHSLRDPVVFAAIAVILKRMEGDGKRRITVRERETEIE